MESPVALTAKVAQVIVRSSTDTQLGVETSFQEVTFGERTLVAIRKDVNVKEGSWVKVQGTLVSYWNTKNMMGADLKIPVVAAIDVLSISRSEAVPPLATANVGKTVTQGGLALTLTKVEIASSETRVYVKASNGSSTKASLYAYDAVIVQQQNQVKRKDLFGEKDVQEPDTTLVPGTVTEGVIMFNALDPSVRQAKLIWSEPRTEDYKIKFADWIWEFAW